MSSRRNLQPISPDEYLDLQNVDKETAITWERRFCDVYEEHRERLANTRADRQRIQRASRAVEKSDPEDVRHFIDGAKTATAIVERRFKVGFEWFGGYIGGTKFVAGSPIKPYHREAFVEFGLRSTQAPILRKFVTCTPKKSRLRSGHGKAILCPAGSKLLSLDDEYLDTNKEMRAILRIDVDREFASADVLLAAIAATGAPTPNLIVCHNDSNSGRVRNPHLLYILENAINFLPTGRRKPQAAFVATLRSVTYALMAIGADPGGLHNSTRVKNPLSPLWTTVIGRATPFASLAELGVGLRRGVTDQMLWPAREAASPTDFIPRSNSFFGAVRAVAFSKISEFKAVDSEGEFVQAIALASYEIAAEMGISDGVAAKTANSVSAWTWQHHDPARIRRKSSRCGVMAPPLASVESATERMAEGGKYGAQRRAEKSIAAMRAACERILGLGKTPTQTTVATESGTSIATVKRHWAAVVSFRSIDKKVVPSPPGNLKERAKATGPSISIEQPSSSVSKSDVPANPETDLAVPVRPSIPPFLQRGSGARLLRSFDEPVTRVEREKDYAAWLILRDTERAA